MSAREREALNKQKNRKKQQEKEKRAKEKAAHQSSDQNPEEYYLVADNNPLDMDIWSIFNAKHASKKVDKAQLIANRGSPRHLVDTAPVPEAQRPEVTDAWLKTSLACPLCNQTLRRMVKTQGAGGWHSVLEHLTKCRQTSSIDICSVCDGEPTIDDAIAGAWRMAAEASSRKKQAREARLAKDEEAHSCSSDQSSTSDADNESFAACKFCERKFRTNDAASLASHETACKAKRERKKVVIRDALEATQHKVSLAEQDAQLMHEQLTQAQKKLHTARSRGEVLAKERKERARAEAKQAKKTKGSKKATSYYTPSVEEPPAETKLEFSQTLQKAERAVTLAKKRLDAAYQTIEERKKVAQDVCAHAEGDMKSQREKKVIEDKKRLQEGKKLTFMPASKRSSEWQPLKTQKKGGKKQSKEQKALAAKTKSEAKKERRNAPREMNDMLQSD